MRAPEAPTERVRSAVIVVEGTLVATAPAPAREGDARGCQTSSLEVREVLLQRLAPDRVPDVALPIQAGQRLPLTQPAQPMMSLDIIHPVGTTGIWLLHARDGRLWTPHPHDLQPLTMREALRAAIAAEPTAAPAPAP